MQERKVLQEKSLQEKPAYQYCYALKQLLDDNKLLIKNENLFFQDGLSAVRTAYKTVYDNLKTVMAMVMSYESQRGELEIPKGLLERLETARWDLQKLEQEVQGVQDELNGKQAELEAKKKDLNDRILTLRHQRISQVEIERRERNKSFLQIENEKRRLENMRNHLRSEMQAESKQEHTGVFAIIPKRKSKKAKAQQKEISAIDMKLVELTNIIEGWKNKIIESHDNPEIHKLETELLMVESDLQFNNEAYLEKIMEKRVKLEAAKERLKSGYAKLNSLSAKRNAAIPNQLMQHLNQVQENFNVLVQVIENINDNKKLNEHVMNKVKTLHTNIMDVKDRTDYLLSLLWSPDVGAISQKDVTHSPASKNDVISVQDDNNLSSALAGTFFFKQGARSEPSASVRSNVITKSMGK